MKVMPAEGRVVRDPNTYAVVPPEGVEVDDTDLYWARRLRDGDVVAAGSDPEAEPHHDAPHPHHAHHNAPAKPQQGKAT